MRWPVLLSYKGDNELVFIANQAEWMLDPDFQSSHFDEGDRIIDTDGYLYQPIKDEKGIALVKLEEKYTLENLIALVQAHMFEQAGATCVSKVGASSIDQVMNIMDSMNEYDKSQEASTK